MTNTKGRETKIAAATSALLLFRNADPFLLLHWCERDSLLIEEFVVLLDKLESIDNTLSLLDDNCILSLYLTSIDLHLFLNCCNRLEQDKDCEGGNAIEDVSADVSGVALDRLRILFMGTFANIIGGLGGFLRSE